MAKIPRGEKLTAHQRRWVQLVAAGATDMGAYQEAYGATEKTAKANAYRLRTNYEVLRALEAAYLQGDDQLKISKQARLGRLGRAILRGNDRDAIRAVDIYSKLVGDYKTIEGSDSKQGEKSILDLLGGAQHSPGE